MNITEIAQEMLEQFPLCDHCLGRQFAFLGYGMENEERGKILKTLLAMKGHDLVLSKKREGNSLLRILAQNGSFLMATNILHKLNRKTRKRKVCYLCEERFESLDNFFPRVQQSLSDYSFETFLVGIKLPTKIEEREDEFKSRLKVQHSEGLRSEFSRTIGKRLTKATGKSVDFLTPQVVVIINPFTEYVHIQANPIFIRGNYRKLVRGIPQSKWFCTKCRGQGCPECNHTGKRYTESVEEYIAKPILEQTLGESSSFHGAGREDVDARMLGQGRPFIIQIKEPRKRRIYLPNLEKKINERATGKVEVIDLRFVDREDVRRLKSLETSQKTYRVGVKLSRKVSDEDLDKIKDSFTDVIIFQKTPKRVMHRRADRIREKHIYETAIKRISPLRVEMKIRCQGGLYIKELITGDDGRTEPSVSSLIKANAKPFDLDVLDISI